MLIACIHILLRFVGADLQLVCSEAILAAVRRHFGSTNSSGGANNGSSTTTTTATSTANESKVKDAEARHPHLTAATAAAAAAAAAGATTGGLVVTPSDLLEGLRRVRPSALREVRGGTLIYYHIQEYVYLLENRVKVACGRRYIG